MLNDIWLVKFLLLCELYNKLEEVKLQIEQ